MQPFLGKMCDLWKKRVVFVVGLCALGCIGIGLLLGVSPMARYLGWFHSNNDRESFDTPVILLWIFLSFGISDVSYDCLLIPGRALLDDYAAPIERGEEANAIFTGFQLVGRLLGLLVVSSNVTNSGFGGVFRGEDAHLDAVLCTNVVYLMVTVVVVLCFVTDVGSSPMLERQNGEYHVNDVIHRDDVMHSDDDAIHHDDSGDETDDFISNYKEGIASLGDDNCVHDQEEIHLSNPSSNNPHYHPLSVETNDHEQYDRSSSTSPTTSNSFHWCKWEIDATVLLSAVQAAGWTAITSQSFFHTTWRGEQIGSIDLALQGVVGIITSALLPLANKHIGAANVWLASELSFHLLMASIAFVNVDGVAPRIISALCGINYAVHATNGLLVAAKVVSDPSKRARTIAMVNNALPMGQFVTALLGGWIAQHLGGFEYVFVCFGLVGCIVTGFVWIVSWRRMLFVLD